MRGPILGGALPHVKFGSNLNIVTDGNSLVNGQGGLALGRLLVQMAPVATSDQISGTVASSAYGGWQSDTGARVLNVSISGQTWLQMNGTAGGTNGSTDVDGAWIAGKTNVLLVWEGTNDIAAGAASPSYPGRTGAQAAQDAADYIAARLAKNPWLVVIGTCLPRQPPGNWSTTDAVNAQIDAYNALIRANYRSMGARVLFDVRQAGSAFNLPDYQAATFEAAAADPANLWASGETGGHLHLSTAGYTYVLSNFIIPALRRLRGR